MKILILSFFLVLCSVLYSQGNLQFNQVLTFEPGESYTVPTGKVLKIESVSMNGNAVTVPMTLNKTWVVMHNMWETILFQQEYMLPFNILLSEMLFSQRHLFTGRAATLHQQLL